MYMNAVLKFLSWKSLLHIALWQLVWSLLLYIYMLRMKQSLFGIERVLSVNSKRLILQMANRLAEDGYRDVGYKYVSIDVSSVSGFENYCCLLYRMEWRP